MIFLGLLCLTVCTWAQPAVYVSRTSFPDYPLSYYYNLGASMIALAPAKDAEDSKEIPIPGVPQAPYLFPFSLFDPIMIDPIALKPEEAHEEPKEEEIEAHKEEEHEEEELHEEEHEESEVIEFKEEEDKEEKEEKKDKKDEIPMLRIPEDLMTKHALVRVKPPQFITDYMQYLTDKYPFLVPIFGPKPPTAAATPMIVAPAPAPAPVPEPAAIPVAAMRYPIEFGTELTEPLVPLIKK